MGSASRPDTKKARVPSAVKGTRAFASGADYRTRTCNPRITSTVRYQLRQVGGPRIHAVLWAVVEFGVIRSRTYPAHSILPNVHQRV